MIEAVPFAIPCENRAFLGLLWPYYEAPGNRWGSSGGLARRSIEASRLITSEDP